MEKQIDKIDRYLDGSMNAEEKSAFETEMHSSSDLQNQVTIQRDLRAGIERLGMKKVIASHFRKMTLKNKIYKWGIATVAVGLICVASYFAYTKFYNSTESERTHDISVLKGKDEPDKNIRVDSCSETAPDTCADTFQQAKSPDAVKEAIHTTADTIGEKAPTFRTVIKVPGIKKEIEQSKK